jgi:hypothetical protein
LLLNKSNFAGSTFPSQISHTQPAVDRAKAHLPALQKGRLLSNNAGRDSSWQCCALFWAFRADLSIHLQCVRCVHNSLVLFNQIYRFLQVLGAFKKFVFTYPMQTYRVVQNCG